MKHPYLQTGKIVSTHGVRGEVKLLPWADGPEFLLQFHTLYLDGRPYPVSYTHLDVYKRQGYGRVSQYAKPCVSFCAMKKDRRCRPFITAAIYAVL